MNSESNVQCVADVHAVLGEGPVWVEREAALYWVDIKGWKIFRLGEGDALQEWATPFRVGSLAPRASGGFIAGTDEGIALIDLAGGKFEIIHHPEAHLPDNRFNDGKVDRAGRFWAGSMDDNQKNATGALYRIGPGLAATRIDEGYNITNGPAFSLAGDVMYHSDTARQVTYVFDVDAAGNATNRRVFATYAPNDGYPDGMTVDAEDCLWIAFWDGWCVKRFSAAGECLVTLELPVQKPTSCAFGGPDLSKLFITSASIGLSLSQRAEQPCAGDLFMLDTGVTGLADVPFEG